MNGERYERQVSLQEIGEAGQENLKNARIAIIGAGGLGAAVIPYLAAAGIGYLRIIDKDFVVPSNLNRQLLHWEKDLGRAKVESATEKVKSLNSEIAIEGFNQSFVEGTAEKLLENIDLVVDCLDNFPTRYILNDWAMKLEIPFIHGACRGWEGRVTVIVPNKTPCLRCIVPTPPRPEVFPIIGVTAGLLGMIQATEAIKRILNRPNTLEGRWLIYDGDALKFRIIETDRETFCTKCQPKTNTMIK